jgi:hypothetical protein
MIRAKDFANREELEAYIKKTFGETTEAKQEEIRGTRAELKRLKLTDTTRIWGVPCVITDKPTEPTGQKKKVERGEIFKSKLT